MLAYIGRRFGYMVLMMALVSVASFIIMKLPPGDYLTSYIQRLEMKGQRLARSGSAGLPRSKISSAAGGSRRGSPGRRSLQLSAEGRGGRIDQRSESNMRFAIC